MRLLLAVSGIGDRVVEAEPGATVAQLVTALDTTPPRGPRTIRVERQGAILAPHMPLDGLDLRSGDRVSVVGFGPATPLDEGPDPSAEPSLSLRILTGPLAGQTFHLGPGHTTVGRASRNDLVLRDPGLSRRHATLYVDASSVVVTDLGATNGIRIEGLPIDGPTALRSGQRLLLGQSWVAVEHHPVPVVPVEGRLIFDRPQRLISAYPGRTFQVPAPPDLGTATGPIGQIAGRVHQRQVSHSYDRMIDQVVADLALGRRQEREARLKEAPSIDDVLLGVRAQTRLWERRITDPDVLQVRLGLAELPTRHRVEVEPGGSPGLRTRIDRLPRTYGTIDGVPATADLGSPGGLTLRGPRDRIRDLAASLVGQLVGLNPPDQLGVMLLGDATEGWDWLKWLPHADLLGDGRPPTGERVIELVGQFLDADAGGEHPEVARPPYLVVIVDDSSALGGADSAGASELVRLMAKGAERGLHPLLLAGEGADLPLAASGLFGATVTVDGQIGRLAVRGDLMQVVEPVALEPARRETVVELARLMAPLVMRGAFEAAALEEIDETEDPVVTQELTEFLMPSTDDFEVSDDPGIHEVVSVPGLMVAPLAFGPVREIGEPEPVPQAAPVEEAPVEEVPVEDEPVAQEAPVERDDGPTDDPTTPDLFDLPRSDDDARLVLGSFRMPDADEDAVLAFSPLRDGTLGLIGDAGSEVYGCLLTVAAATNRIEVPPAELPVVYALGTDENLVPLVALPNVRAVTDGRADEAIELLTEIEQLMDDRLLTLELAGVDTIGEFREARPDVTLRRVLVLIDGLDRLASLLESDHPGRTREVVGQLLELGSGLGLHLVFTVEHRDEIDPLLAPKVGRWLQIGEGPEQRGRVVLEGADVRFAVPGGSWDRESIEQALTSLAADRTGSTV